MYQDSKRHSCPDFRFKLGLTEVVSSSVDDSRIESFEDESAYWIDGVAILEAHTTNDTQESFAVDRRQIDADKEQYGCFPSVPQTCSPDPGGPGLLSAEVVLIG